MKNEGKHSGRRRNARRGNTRLVSLGAAASLAAAGVGTVGASTASAAGPAPQLVSCQPLAGTFTPTVNGLRIRSGPGTNYRVYGLLYRGDRMKITRSVRTPSAGCWFKVTLTQRSASGLPAGFTGWVYAAYLRHV